MTLSSDCNNLFRIVEAVGESKKEEDLEMMFYP